MLLFNPIKDVPETRDQLARILTSQTFRRSLQLQKLLKYLAEETMAGRVKELTQTKISEEAFPEEQMSLSTLRIAMMRLRSTLDEYFKAEASSREMRFQILPRQYIVSYVMQKRTESNLSMNQGGLDSHTPKIISRSSLLGEQGIVFVQQRCLDMGYVWYPTRLEAGIDGYIEIRGEKGEVTNCIIQVQVKATDAVFEAETESSFEFRCSSRDLNYWLSGNAPVILVRCRPRTGEAYWISLKDYFKDLERRKTGKIIFDKKQTSFDLTAKPFLERLAAMKDSGQYLGTRPRSELIYSNLLELASFPETYYTAMTQYRTPGEIFAALNEFNRPAPGEWVLSSKMLTSFHDLSAPPFRSICDRGTVEQLDTTEWSDTTDPARGRHFVQLLNACLRQELYRKGVKFSRENQCYYFRAPQDLSEREYVYQSRENRTSRSVFKGYPKKNDPVQMAYYRHSAFEGHFVHFDNKWFLQIAPTYHFTRDGERLSRFAPDLLSGIKRLETNQAVQGQVMMWAHLLTERTLFDTGSRFLDFAGLLEFELDAGIDDEAWLKHEELAMKPFLQPESVNPQKSFIL
jgi:hypothetical protein